LSSVQRMEIIGLKKAYAQLKSASALVVYDNLNLSFLRHRITCLMGPSGCGKTTLLNIISGLVKADAGEMRGFSSGPVSYLFQEPRLLPWKTVEQNVEFVIRGLYRDGERAAKIAEHLTMVGLWDFRSYYPERLSGGMKQRVGMARAFVFPSDLLLMDEHYRGLDLPLRLSLLDAFISLWQRDRRTVIFVTHDPDEAFYLGDEVHVFSSLPAQVVRTVFVDVPRETRRFGEGPIKALKVDLLSHLGLPVE